MTSSAAAPSPVNTASATLTGVRVLVVEDEPMVAALICATLESASALVIGPYCTLASAEAALGSEVIDAGLLDVNIAGEKIFPVAERLHARGVPFLLLSGYGSDAIPPDRPDWRALAKPFRMAGLVTALAEHIAFVAGRQRQS